MGKGGEVSKPTRGNTGFSRHRDQRNVKKHKNISKKEYD